MKSFVLAIAAFFAANHASAMSVDWSGQYRFEWVQVDRPSLSVPGDRKAYGLNYLGLSPKIIATDGVEITSKFDVLPSTDSTYSMSQAGQVWGQGIAQNQQNGNPNVLTTNKSPSSLAVRELYLSVNQEYGSLLVGRAPFQFGLGLNWNAGNGPFDHWSTNSDLVAYKFIVGNVFFMPMISRVAVGSVSGTSATPFDPSANTGAEHVIQDLTLQVQYESEETGSLLGVIVNRRQSSDANDDIPYGAGSVGGSSAYRQNAYSTQTTGFTLGRKWETFRFRMEGDFVTGDTGLMAVDQQGNSGSVRVNSYGIAMEMDLLPTQSKLDYSLRLGVASGDNTGTNDLESFQFNRNYHVAQLLFRHRLGKFDVLQTNLIKDNVNHTVQNSIDDETVSNAFYLAPTIHYAMSDRWTLNNTLVYAQLMANSTTANGFKKDLGAEWDIETVYKPRTNIQWVNDLGLLFPGGAFRNGSTDASGNVTSYDTGFNFGFESKVAITF